MNKTSPRRGGETATRSGYYGEYGALYAQVEAAKAATRGESRGHYVILSYAYSRPQSKALNTPELEPSANRRYGVNSPLGKPGESYTDVLSINC